MKSDTRKLIIASNRLPIFCQQKRNKAWEIQASSGGLVTALDPVFKDRGGTWVGWPGTTGARPTQLKAPLKAASSQLGYDLIPVSLNKKEVEQFYLGFSNEIIWPLFHDLQTRCHFHPDYFRTYETVNRKFARVLARQAHPQDLIWVHDYHLMNVAQELRALGQKNRLAFFLHIPFPPPDIFLKLPWRKEILLALLKFNVLGFQTVRDVRNFLQCVRMLVMTNLNQRDLDLSTVQKIKIGDHQVALGSFPISVDFEAFAKLAADPKIIQKAKYLREDLPHRMIALGIDRLDYTKGIPDKLKAFRNALERFPELRGNLTLVQNVVPSREHITEYHELKNEIEQRVSEINGEFSRAGWVPVHYKFHHMDREELLAYYQMAKIALVTPLKDGMNLVAKEYCAAAVEEDSVLILSEFAGAAAELKTGALLVNPYDTEGMAEALYQAYRMDFKERRKRMRALRTQVKNHDIFVWAEHFLNEAFNHQRPALFERPEVLHMHSAS